MSTPDEETPDETDYEDVDEVIGIAERMMQKQESALSDEELQEVGAELGIPAEYVDRARNELQRRREKERERKKRRRRRRRRWKRRLTIGATVAGVIFGLWSWVAVSNLRQTHARIESQRAEIANQQDRKEAIEEQFADQPDSPEKQAQLTGSENRLRVAIQRYNRAAADYNRRAGSFPAALWAPLVGLPADVPTANDLPGGS